MMPFVSSFFSFSTLMKKRVVAVALQLLCLTASSNGDSAFECPPGFFSFGTSLSDTGNVDFAFPGVSPTENLPYGETFFGRGSFRFSDGRLVVDFLALAFEYPLLTAYLQSVAPDFRHGVNFAASGATAITEAPQVPFVLDFQVAQFLRFAQSTAIANQLPELSYLNSNLLPSKSTFDKGLYLFSFGRNDLSFGYTLQGYTPATAITTLVPQIVQKIVGGIQTLYTNGARNFLVFNVPPQGCSPQYLTLLNATEFDQYGCSTPFNQVNEVYNTQLRAAVENLRATLNDSSILLFDYYAAYISVLQNPQSFGFAPENTLVACCGVGGKYNYNAVVGCGATGAVNNVTVTVGSCSNPNEYINWDGIHFTDAFNGAIAQLLLTGKFLDPPINFQKRCKLDFSKFTGANFTQAYPNGYIILPPFGP